MSSRINVLVAQPVVNGDATSNGVARGSCIRITPWAPDSGGAWSQLINDIDHASVEQLPQWFTVIEGAYGHSPLYFLGEDEDGVVPSVV